MAYRRRQGFEKSGTFKEEAQEDASSRSLAAQAIRASAAHRPGPAPAFPEYDSKEGPSYDYTSMGSSTEEGSFWGVLARKAKAILEEDMEPFQSEYMERTGPQFFNPSPSRIHKMKDTMNRIGDTIGNAFEEGRTIVENSIQETRRLQIRRKGDEQTQTSQEDQLKASRDVAMATAAKAKLLLRELKTVKADLAFAKQRCSQLEEENKILREAREKGVNPEDDDMIRLQLETLLDEKSRLANENSIYARENRFLREIVDYHQLTMQDVVYLDEGIEEVTQVYPVSRTLSISPPLSPAATHQTNNSLSRSSSVPTKDTPKGY